MYAIIVYYVLNNAQFIQIFTIEGEERNKTNICQANYTDQM